METTLKDEVMRTILQELNDSLAQEDLFLNWKNELQLRKHLRAAPYAVEGLLIESDADFDFLKRSLYYSDHKELFLELLYYNRDSQTVLDCLGKAPAILATEFLAFIRDSILVRKPLARDLQFLINLYREDFNPDFAALIDAMDADLCAHLMARTSNNTLRELLQHRQAALSGGDKIEPYGLTESRSSRNDYPTLFGDKIELMAAAVKSLQNSQDLIATAPLNGKTIAALLQGAEMLFRSGLITDCLSLVAELLRQPGAEVFDLLLDPDSPFHKPANQLLRKALPFYCMLVDPVDPHRYALELYRSLFPGFSPDPASLIYLDINSIVVPSLHEHRQYAHFELAQKAAKLQDYRPDDLLAAALQKWDHLSSQASLPALQQVIAERITSLPHESFTVMGVLRLGQQEGLLALDQASASRLLQDYLLFFHWIPAPPFMNEELWQHLGPLANRASRRAGGRVINILQEFHASAGADHAAGPGKSNSWENHLLSKQLLLSKYMGVF
jgi:hypothetical protein